MSSVVFFDPEGQGDDVYCLVSYLAVSSYLLLRSELTHWITCRSNLDISAVELWIENTFWSY